MSLIPSLFALCATLLLMAASSRSVQDTGLIMSQQAERLLAMQRAQLRLVQAAEMLADPNAEFGAMSEIEDGEYGRWASMIETLPIATDAELPDLPLTLQRVTVTDDGRGARVRLQADFAVDGCESAHDEAYVPRVRRIAWRQLSPD